MSTDYMNYGHMVENALRQVVHEALTRVATVGLPGNHHFYITFRTAAPGVSIPSYLSERYPDEMTIVLQHQFHGLEVSDEQFIVTLSFNRIPERLVIPFEALTAFADPSVQFGLQFRASESNDTIPASIAKVPMAVERSPAISEVDSNSPQEKPRATGTVVTLDAFRKK